MGRIPAALLLASTVAVNVARAQEEVAPPVAATALPGKNYPPGLVIHQTRPGDLEDREIRFVVPRTEYRQDFPVDRGHPAGVFLYGEAIKPEKERFHLEYMYVMTEFRFRRPDGLSDVVLIETSPQIRGSGLGGLFFRVPGSEYVTIAWGCRDDRTCDGQHTIAYRYEPDLASAFVVCTEPYRGDLEPVVRRMLRVGHAVHGRMRRLTLAQIRRLDRSWVLADEIATTLPATASPFGAATLRRVARSRLEIAGRFEADTTAP